MLAVALVWLPAPIRPAPLCAANTEGSHEHTEVSQGFRLASSSLPEQAAEIEQLVRGLSGGGADVNGKRGRLRQPPAGHALLSVGVAQPMALIEDDQRPCPP